MTKTVKALSSVVGVCWRMCFGLQASVCMARAIRAPYLTHNTQTHTHTQVSWMERVVRIHVVRVACADFSSLARRGKVAKRGGFLVRAWYATGECVVECVHMNGIWRVMHAFQWYSIMYTCNCYILCIRNIQYTFYMLSLLLSYALRRYRTSAHIKYVVCLYFNSIHLKMIRA